MRKIISCILVMVLLASAVPLAVMPAGATGISSEYKKLFDGDNEITKGELANAILSCMLGGGTLKIEELRDAAHVYAYWNGKPKTVTDSVGRTVTIYKPVKRVVIAYWIDAAMTLQALKAEDTVVGVTQVIKKRTNTLPGTQQTPKCWINA